MIIAKRSDEIEIGDTVVGIVTNGQPQLFGMTNTVHNRMSVKSEGVDDDFDYFVGLDKAGHIIFTDKAIDRPRHNPMWIIQQ